MTTTTKVLGLGLLALLGWVAFGGPAGPGAAPPGNALDDALDWVKSWGVAAPELGGTVTVSRFAFQGSQCVRVDYDTNGKSTNTAVDAAECCADNPAAGPCHGVGYPPDASGLDGAAAFIPSLPPKTSG